MSKKMGRSTGPRTPRGKARSSQNAARHWIESKRILQEEQKEAAILRSGFEEDFKPQGLCEHEIVDDLVFNRLHKRRIDIVLTREFSKATIEKTIELSNERPVERFMGNLVRGNSAEPAEGLHPDVFVHVLEDLINAIVNRGPQAEHLTVLRRICGDQPTMGMATAMLLLAEVEALQAEKDETVAATRRKDLQQPIIAALHTELTPQKFHQMLASNLLEIEFPLNFQEPPRDVLETLLRYRTANAREFSGLLESLERIRRLRRSAA
jgi:hypothetical protein